MAKNETGKTAADASQLLASISTSNFIYSLIVIEKYSAMLEPITQSLQSVEMDLIKAQNHIKVLLGVLETHRQNTKDDFKFISSKVDDLSDELGIHLLMARVCKKQTQRPNFEGTSIHEYYRLSLYIPYLDSIITSLETRFSEKHEDKFALFYLLPNKMKEIGKHDFENYMSKISSIYDIDNFTFLAFLAPASCSIAHCLKE